MPTFAEIVAYFAYDNLRADGFMVRWCRLNMHECTYISLLCWGMEVAYALAYFTGKWQAWSVAFLTMYLAVNVAV